MRYALAAFIVLFAVLSLLPGFQHFTGALPKKGLSGIVVHRKFPSFSSQRLLSGEFQREMERWFMQNTGLWGIFVTTENQINFSLFQQASTDYKSSVVIGKNNTPLQREYLEDLNRMSLSGPERLAEQVDRLMELQKALAKNGIGFLILVSPNKVNLYPELLRDSFILKDRLHLKRNYDYFVELLRQKGVQHIDAHEYFLSHSEEFPHGAFAKSGSHWNDVATCVVTRMLVETMQDYFQKPLRNFTCEPIKVFDVPRATDRDLSRITNLWDPTPLYGPTPYPVTKTLAKGGEFQPRVLFVGSSFLWSVLRFMDYHKVYSKRDMYYYFRTNHAYPSGRRRSINETTWQKNLLKNNFVVIEINESKVREVGFGFVEEALEALEQQ